MKREESFEVKFFLFFALFSPFVRCLLAPVALV